MSSVPASAVGGAVAPAPGPAAASSVSSWVSEVARLKAAVTKQKTQLEQAVKDQEDNETLNILRNLLTSTRQLLASTQ